MPEQNQNQHAFVERYYKQSYSRFAPKPRPHEQTHVPRDYVRQLLQVRRHLRLTQTELAEQIGAAGKAVVYQWESRKRKPSPVLWKRVQRLIDAASTEHRALAPN